jgi:hypothetical protein
VDKVSKMASMEKRLGCEYKASGVAFIAASQWPVGLVFVLVTCQPLHNKIPYSATD